MREQVEGWASLTVLSILVSQTEIVVHVQSANQIIQQRPLRFLICMLTTEICVQGLDSVKADLLRAQLFGSNTVSQQQAVSQAPQLLPVPPGLALNSELPSADLHSPPTELDGPSADPQVPQQTLTEKGTAGKTVITSKVPKQASSDGDDPQQTSPSASPDAEASFPGLAPAVTQSKKRKADKADVTVEGDATAAMEAEHAESAQQAEEQRALPKQAAVRSGGGPKKKQGTLQAAFAKAKVGYTAFQYTAQHSKKYVSILIYDVLIYHQLSLLVSIVTERSIINMFLANTWMGRILAKLFLSGLRLLV